MFYVCAVRIDVMRYFKKFLDFRCNLQLIISGYYLNERPITENELRDMLKMVVFVATRKPSYTCFSIVMLQNLFGELFKLH
jgi:hypothetical protein